MQWRAELGDASAIATLRGEVGRFLRRFGASTSDFRGADAIVGDALEPLKGTQGEVVLGVEWTDEAARLNVRRAASAGAQVIAVELPVERPPVSEIHVHPSRPDSLPAPEEAGADGTFGREPFLRALLVQLTERIEREHGSDAAEDLVAQVGADVGERMEDEFRRAHQIVERLRPDQMTDVFLRLKHAIDGDFFVIEATDERIVLGNRRCPFGDVVRRAPGLCQMTSSVFGGIAARNAGTSTVQLDRRIAAGDPECRVTVWLDEREDGISFGHRYRSSDKGSEPLSVVLAIEYGYLREALTRALSGHDIEVVAHVPVPDVLLPAIDRHRPDVALIDFSEVNTAAAIESAAEIRARYPDVAVLILAEHLNAPAARELFARHAGHVGYVFKDALGSDEFVAAIRRVAAGGSAVDPKIVADLAGTDDPLGELTTRELEVLELIAEGLTNRAIAERLVVTKRAVEKHVGSIFRKLAVGDSARGDRRVLAARAFIEHGRSVQGPGRGGPAPRAAIPFSRQSLDTPAR